MKYKNIIQSGKARAYHGDGDGPEPGRPMAQGIPEGTWSERDSHSRANIKCKRSTCVIFYIGYFWYFHLFYFGFLVDPNRFWY